MMLLHTVSFSFLISLDISFDFWMWWAEWTTMYFYIFASFCPFRCCIFRIFGFLCVIWLCLTNEIETCTHISFTVIFGWHKRYQFSSELNNRNGDIYYHQLIRAFKQLQIDSDGQAISLQMCNYTSNGKN